MSSYQGVCPATGGSVHQPVSVRTSSLREKTTGTNQRREPSDQGVCPATEECGHPPESVHTHRGVSAHRLDSSWTELIPQAPGRIRIKEGSACTPIAWKRPTIEKEWVEAGNTRIPPERGNRQRKHKQITREEGEGGSGSHTKSTQHLSENTNK